MIILHGLMPYELIFCTDLQLLYFDQQDDIYIIRRHSRKKVPCALRRAKRSFEIIKVKGFFLISPQ